MELIKLYGTFVLVDHLYVYFTIPTLTNKFSLFDESPKIELRDSIDNIIKFISNQILKFVDSNQKDNRRSPIDFALNWILTV